MKINIKQPGRYVEFSNLHKGLLPSLQFHYLHNLNAHFHYNWHDIINFMLTFTYKNVDIYLHLQKSDPFH